MKKNRNPKHIYYVSLLNSQEWQGVNGLRAKTLRAHPLCEKCGRWSAVDVHHLQPVEGVGRYYQPGEELPDDVKAAMRARCFNPNNVIALCVPCHIETHREMRSHQGQFIKRLPTVENEQTRNIDQWVQQVSCGKCEPRPHIKNGIRRTKYGYLTADEFKQKQAEELEKWKEKVNEFANVKGTPTVDAGTED